MASLELLERLRSGFHEPVEVLERKPPVELVSPVDLVRLDELGRQMVACPAGQSPPPWLQLTEQERAALVDPPDPPPDGTLEPGHCGFTPRNTTLGGFTIESGGTW